VLTVTCHQLRHTWATGVANAGMSLQALMALLGHVTPQMTIRYATLASPTLRTAYDEAMGKMRRQFTLTPVGKPIIPDKVSWLNSEMLKTRVAPIPPRDQVCPPAGCADSAGSVGPHGGLLLGQEARGWWFSGSDPRVVDCVVDWENGVEVGDA
jgi:hypothetical protein